ncbi:Plasma membrane low glucose sensor [Knufia peltigerae]|uniref:Plasma membrane low glucose sensor n=1 Tax=Knufia peltigerae TaxID=1002370 RepID=A0AA38XMC1_9EURO|nr:Plasma membrane low glucose sensor [Knufia peltigerae]
MWTLSLKPADVPGSAVPAILVGLFVSSGGVLFGYDTGIIGGILAMKKWRELFSTGYINPVDHLPDVNTAQQSEIVSILSAGTFFGAIFSAPAADYLGRRWAMILNSCVFAFGVILQVAATSIPLFSAGRFFAGGGVGLLSATIPLYQSETAPKWIRGTLVGCYQLSITVGLFLAAIVNNATKDRHDTGCYRIPVAVQFLFAIILVVGMLLLPETPRYLIKVAKPKEAAKALARLRRLPEDHPSIQEEVAEIQANHEFELALGQASYLSCIKKPIRKRLLTGIFLQALQQLTGVNFIFYYGTSYFSNSGLENPFTVSVITSVVNICSTLPGLWLVEKWGRRRLLMFGALGMATSQMIVASVGTALPDNVAANKALIAFVCIYIFFFACSWGPAAWVITGEIFPLKARAKGLSMTTASNWLLNWAIAYSTPFLVSSGPGNADLGSKVFFIWGGFCCLCWVYVFFTVYETKGLSLEEVDELYNDIKYAWRSQHYQPSSTFVQMQEDVQRKASVRAAGGETKTIVNSSVHIESQ